MKYSIVIDNKLKIIRYNHIGLIDAEEIGEVWKELLSIKEFTEMGYNLLSDYRNTQFNFSVSIVKEIVEFMHSIKHIVKGKKQSILVDNPISTAGSILLENEVNEKVGFLIKVFSTEDAALRWLIM